MPHPYSAAHQWVGATYVPLPENLAANAARRGTTRVPAETKVDILEVACAQCRRPYDAVAGEKCVAAVNRDHLIGGPTGERKPRKGPGSGADPGESAATG